MNQFLITWIFRKIHTYVRDMVRMTPLDCICYGRSMTEYFTISEPHDASIDVFELHRNSWSAGFVKVLLVKQAGMQPSITLLRV